MESPWVGFKHFRRFFNAYSFTSLLRNTLWLSTYNLIVGFPIPIIFALLLNYLRQTRLKKTVQMVSYAPFFISTVVICGMIAIFTTQDTGIFNVMRGWFGMESVDFMSKPEWFDDIYVWSGIWQGMGWNAIIYLAALSNVDPALHEAADIDGATRMQKILHINIPTILPTVIIMLILRMGEIASIGYEKVYLMQNDLNVSTAEVISTYVYKRGIVNSNYSFSTAIGLFNNVINVTMLLIANKCSKKASGTSLF